MNPGPGPEGRSARLPGFYRQSLDERQTLVADWAGLTDSEVAILRGDSLDADDADQMVENVIGVHALPLGIAANFVVNGREVLVPMCIEEPSVVAGASLSAKLARSGGGFAAQATDAEMIGQLQVLDVVDPIAARAALLDAREDLLALANRSDPVLFGLGGGARDIQVRILEETAAGPMLIVHLVLDCLDAMGANAVNTACEALAPRVEAISGGRVLLRILSNLADRRLVSACCRVPAQALSFCDYDGGRVAQGIVEAWAFAAADPYRAATHNKGIMNGVDAVVLATGNDWRAVEAGAHAYAARTGRYTSLSTWGRDAGGDLVGEIEMPLALGIIGGATRVHPTAQVALKILGVQTARELAEVVAAVGLAQNLAALRALATEGIQRGHMRLHARQMAVAAGAMGDEVARIAERIAAEGAIRPERARLVLEEIRDRSAIPSVQKVQ